MTEREKNSKHLPSFKESKIYESVQFFFFLSIFWVNYYSKKNKE